MRPKKYMTTSSSDKEKSKRNRKDECDQFGQTIHIENDIDQIRIALNNNKENDAGRDNILTECAPFINNSSLQISKPAAKLYNPPNDTIEACDHRSAQKMYTELLPPSSASSFKITDNTSTFFNPTSNSYISQNIRVYEESFPTSLVYETPSLRNEAHHQQVIYYNNIFIVQIKYRFLKKCFTYRRRLFN